MEEAQSRVFLGAAQSGKDTLLFSCVARDGRFGSAEIFRSSNGISFGSSKEELVFTKFFGGLWRSPEFSEPFRVSSIDSEKHSFFLTFRKTDKQGKEQFFSAVSADGMKWSRISPMEGIRGHGAAVSVRETSSVVHMLFFGKTSVKVATSPDLRYWTVKRSTILRSREGYFDEKGLSAILAIPAGRGALLFYISENSRGRKTLGSALVSGADARVLWRSDEALWEAPEDWDGRDIRVVGAVSKPGKILLYWQVDGRLLVEEIAQFWKISRGETVSILSEEAKLERFHGNPILHPRHEHDWEAHETFNPAAFLSDDGMVHILYRATGRNGLSSIGYASSRDGFSVDDRLDYPIYASSATLDDVKVTRSQKTCAVPYASGGGWGGSEDPKITRIDDVLYMTYTAFDGYNFPRVALTKIALDDFLSKKWNWSRPVMISPPGEVHKNWTIFPEKIRGKFAILHSISPEIRIDYLDSLDFDGETFLKSERVMKPLSGRWELLVRGVGPTPLKTKEGWLVLYHATTRDCGYKLGAMILDLHDPTKVIARSKTPVLEPSAWYEVEGSKPGVIYSCGAVVKDERLLVYYGSADMVTCVAVVPIERLLRAILRSEKAVPIRYVRLRDK